MKILFRFLFKLLFRVKVDGLENYAKANKRCVIISNHVSFLDAALIACFLPNNLLFAVNTFVAQKWWVKIFLPLVNVFKVDQTNPLAIRKLIQEMKCDRQCLIFPEGRITITGTIMKIYKGPGMVADRSKSDILPIFITGAERTYFSRLKGRVKRKLFPKIKLTIYPPFKLTLPPELKGRERRDRISNQLYDFMTEMQFKSHHYHKTLFNAFLTARERYGKNRLILEDIQRKPHSYQQLLRKIYILGKLIAKKTTPHEKVGVLLPNSLTAFVTFFALHAYGRIPVMLNFTVGERLLLSACHTAPLKVIYTSREFCEKARLNNLYHFLKKAGIEIIYLEDLKNEITFFKKIVGLINAVFPKQRVLTQPHQPAVVLFTSGTEGEPKGVVLSHENIVANCQQVAARMPFFSTDRAFNPLPIFHAAGLTAGTLTPIFSGVRLFLYPSPLHYRLIPELIYDTNSTLLFATNVFLYGYGYFAHPYDFYLTRFIFSGAEKLKPETREMWQKKMGINILEGYGTTETAPVLAISTKMQNKMGSVGRFLPGIEYKLTPIKELENGGALWVKGPNIMLGYLHPDQPGIIHPPKDGWYDTGDVVSIDKDHFIFIQDRRKRFAKVAGEMISLSMVERYCQNLWPRFQHAVLAESDTRKGEHIVLFTTNPNATRKMIVEYVHANGLPEFSIPKKVILIKKMPMMALGKIDYGALKKKMT